MTLPRTFLVATDFSESAERALVYAVELASQLDATIHLVHVLGLPSMAVPEIGYAYNALMMENLTSKAQQELDRLVALHRERVSMAPPRMEIGDARDVIDRIAGAISADLIVMGTHGRRGIRRILLGSVAESVVRTAPCPVLTIRPKHP